MKEFKATYANYAELIRQLGDNSAIKYKLRFLSHIWEMATICGKTIIEISYSPYFRDTDIITFRTITKRRFYKVILHVTQDVHGKRYVTFYDYSLEKRNAGAELEYGFCKDYRFEEDMPYYISEALFCGKD